MRTNLRRVFPLLLTGFLLLVLSAANRAAGTDNSELTKTQREQIYNVLRDVINKGAKLFNEQKDFAGCYRVYEGALLTLRPLLSGHPKLQKAIDEGIAEAEANPSVVQRAFILRRVLDQVRETMALADSTAPDAGENATDKKKPPKTSLWQRLGGKEGVGKVVDDFLATASKDPKVNADRDGKYKIDAEHLKKQLIDFISSATGGPYKYTGKSMKEAHKGMAITDAEFDAAADHLKKALVKNGVKSKDAKALLKIVETTREDIVEIHQPPPDNGKKGAKRAQVYGKVALQGKPLATGRIVFVAESGAYAFRTALNPDGSFSFSQDLPLGTYQVAVRALTGKEAPAAQKSVIPPKYRDPQQSGLRVEVSSGRNAFDFRLSE